MRMVIAVVEMDLRLALELALSEEPGVQIVGVASDAAGLLALTHSGQPELIVLEDALPGAALPELLGALRQRQPPPRLLVLGANPAGGAAALAGGAAAFVLKGDPPEQLLDTFRWVRARDAPPS